jgi:diaminopropionate ammonia-lyase
LSHFAIRNPGAGDVPRDVITVDRSPLAFHRRLPGYAPTALVDAPSLAARFGVGRVVVKAEQERFGLPAFKMLGASWATYRTLVARLGHEPDWETFDDLVEALQALQPMTLAAATDGNHGRAVARMAKLLGYGARIFVPEGTTDARIDGIASEGAEVTVVDGDYDDAVRRSATEAGDDCIVISDTSWPGYVDPPRLVIEGYSTIFWEVTEAVERAAIEGPHAVFVPVGVGAFAAAAVAFYRRPDAPQPAATMVSVEPDSADCVLRSVQAGDLTHVPGPHRSIMAGLNCGLPSLIAWPVISKGLDWCVAVDDDDARAAMRDLAEVGVVAGESAAASLAGLAAVDRAAAGLGEESTVLILSTEGATDPANYVEAVGRLPQDVAPPPADRIL